MTLEFNALVDEVSSSAPSSSGRVDGGEEEGEWPVYANLTNGKVRQGCVVFLTLKEQVEN